MKNNLFLFSCQFVKLSFITLSFFCFPGCNFGQSYSKDTSNLIQIVDTLITEIDSLSEFQTIDSIQTGLNFICGSNYNATKSNMDNLRTRLKRRYDLITDPNERTNFIDSIAGIFTSNLLNQIIPYWYGTEWDFEGHTATPNSGQIACGYFVSTTLKDMGLKLNRYRLAQADPLTEAKFIAIDSANLEEFDTEDFNNLTDLLNGIKDGLYFVGLDNHVGYFYKKDNKNYFIHSNYIDGKVMIEKAENSYAFSSSKYYFTKISLNRALALRWVKVASIMKAP